MQHQVPSQHRRPSIPAFEEVVLHHSAVEGRAGPVEFLGGFAPIPVRGKQGQEHPVSLIVGKLVSFSEPLAELLRQIHAGDRARGQVHKDRLDEALSTYLP